MLSDEEFYTWCHRLKFLDQARNIVERIRSSDPSRRVGGGRKNVSGRYPSRKMGVTIQFESHRVELPTIYELEHDEDVLEFYDQPPQIKLDYQAKNGRKLGVFHTPDFFVIRTNSAGWEECKTEEDLKKLADRSPNRYFRSGDGDWLTPPGESYAEPYGLYYRIRSDAKINWILQRNTIFLEDYFRAESLTVEESSKAAILSIVASQPGITLLELLRYGTKASSDDIYTLIVTEQVYVNLDACPLPEPERCLVFPDRQTSVGYGLMVETQIPTTAVTSPVINLVTGTVVSWDGIGLSIFHVGETQVVLCAEDQRLVELHRNVFENLVQQGKIKSIHSQERPSISKQSWERFHKASPEDQTEALRRYKVIQPYLSGQPPENETIPARTIRDWKAKYLAALQQYSCGYIGLLSHRSAKGNRTRKLPEDTLALMDKFILEDYETLKQKKIASLIFVYGPSIKKQFMNHSFGHLKQ